MVSKVVDSMNTPQFAAMYRSLLLGILGILAWYYVGADASAKEQLRELRTLIIETQTLAAAAVNDNALQQLILQGLRDDIVDHESRIRRVEGIRPLE